MKLYHYSVDSYKDGEKLINGYVDHYTFAEPFILALEKGMSVFMAVLFSTMYTSREIKDLKLRKYENYQKDAVEGIFEYVRQTEFKESSVSRLNCVYYCKTREEAIEYLKEDCLADGLFSKDRIKLLEVDVEDSRIRYYDQQYYNLSMDVIEKNDIEAIIDNARSYYSEKRSYCPLIEIVSDGDNQIIKEILF